MIKSDIKNLVSLRGINELTSFIDLNIPSGFQDMVDTLEDDSFSDTGYLTLRSKTVLTYYPSELQSTKINKIVRVIEIKNK